MKLTLEMDLGDGSTTWRSYRVTESTTITMEQGGYLTGIQYRVLDGEDVEGVFCTILLDGKPLLLGELLETEAPLTAMRFEEGSKVVVVLGPLPPHHLLSLDYTDEHRRVILRPHFAQTTLSRSDLIELIEYLEEHADHMSD
jgi:hypothetical protein